MAKNQMLWDTKPGQAILSEAFWGNFCWHAEEQCFGLAIPLWPLATSRIAIWRREPQGPKPEKKVTKKWHFGSAAKWQKSDLKLTKFWPLLSPPVTFESLSCHFGADPKSHFESRFRYFHFSGFRALRLARHVTTQEVDSVGFSPVSLAMHHASPRLTRLFPLTLKARQTWSATALSCCCKEDPAAWSNTAPLKWVKGMRTFLWGFLDLFSSLQCFCTCSPAKLLTATAKVGNKPEIIANWYGKG